MIVAAAALDPNVELWCLDAKLVELAPWRDLAKAFVGPDIAEATVALDVLQAEMTAATSGCWTEAAQGHPRHRPGSRGRRHRRAGPLHPGQGQGT